MLAGDRVVIHNAGEQFVLKGATVRRARMSAAEIVKILKSGGASSKSGGA
jgi:hypothetical protein